MRDSHTHTRGSADKINRKDYKKVFNLLKIEVKTRNGFKNNSKLTVTFFV